MVHDLTEAFHQEYRVIYASTPELVEQACKIRYAVYCEEFGFEKSSSHQNIESDRFDLFSNHYLIQHKPSSEFVGTIRMVSPCVAETAPLPISQLFGSNQEELKCQPASFCASSISEISRLAVLPEFRNRTLSNTDFSYQASLPIVVIALYATAAADFQLNPERKYLFLLSEPRLVRHLRILGICFEKVGPIIEHRGKRAPHVLKRENWNEGFKGQLYELYRSLVASLHMQGIGEPQPELSAEPVPLLTLSSALASYTVGNGGSETVTGSCTILPRRKIVMVI